MTIPEYVLSFDPGQKDTTWAYCLSTVKDGEFTPVEAGFSPVFEELGTLDFSKHLQFKERLVTSYGTSIDLVAERFIARGFAAKIGEYIPFTLGFWSHAWQVGNVKLLMASQWKIPFKRFNSKYKFEDKRLENWWEDRFAYLTTEENRKKKIVHIQDATAIGLFYYRKILGVDCKLQGLPF